MRPLCPGLKEHPVCSQSGYTRSRDYRTRLYGDKYRCKRLRLEDKESFDISRHMRSALEFIEEARVDRAAILVHCSAGVSRSATVVIAFLMT